MNEKEIIYPSEITFKAIFRNNIIDVSDLKNILVESNLSCNITFKESRTARFISYTVTAVFPTEESLNYICSRVASFEGFMTMF